MILGSREEGRGVAFNACRLRTKPANKNLLVDGADSIPTGRRSQRFSGTRASMLTIEHNPAFVSLIAVAHR